MRGDFRFAWDAVRVNRRWMLLTVAIIAVGVASPVGIQTAVSILADEVAGGRHLPFHLAGPKRCAADQLSSGPRFFHLTRRALGDNARKKLFGVRSGLGGDGLLWQCPISRRGCAGPGGGFVWFQPGCFFVGVHCRVECIITAF